MLYIASQLPSVIFIRETLTPYKGLRWLSHKLEKISNTGAKSCEETQTLTLGVILPASVLPLVDIAPLIYSTGYVVNDFLSIR